MRAMIADGKDLHAMKIENARYYDTGNKLEYIKTVIDFALNDDSLGPDVKDYLAKRLV